MRCLATEQRIVAHGNVMDKYDPEKRVGLIVDEWGTWFDVELGTNPAYLYQQNTMRDAMVAALTLNGFNRHCDRVHMANIAQTVNVLQALLLTDGDRMVKTPTYYVFDLYKEHQGGKEIECEIDTKSVGVDNWKLNCIDISASEKDSIITLTITNVSSQDKEEVEIVLLGSNEKKVESRILTGKIDDYNDFDRNVLDIQSFDMIRRKGDSLFITLPACSIVEIKVF